MSDRINPQSTYEKIMFNAALKRNRYEKAEKEGKPTWDNYSQEVRERYRDYND